MVEDRNLNDTFARLKALLDPVENIGRVEDRMGGVATWVLNAEPGEAYWQLDLVSRTEEKVTNRKVELVTTVLVEGFMPLSFDEPNTAELWRALVDDVCAVLRKEQTTDGETLLNRLPQIRENNRVGMVGGPNSPEVLCHHVQIHHTLVARVEYRPR